MRDIALTIVTINPYCIISRRSTIPVAEINAILPDAEGNEYPKVVDSVRGITSPIILSEGFWFATLIRIGVKIATTVALLTILVNNDPRKIIENKLTI